MKYKIEKKVEARVCVGLLQNWSGTSYHCEMLRWSFWVRHVSWFNFLPWIGRT